MLVIPWVGSAFYLNDLNIPTQIEPDRTNLAMVAVSTHRPMPQTPDKQHILALQLTDTQLREFRY